MTVTHAPCIPWSWILGLDSSLPASLPPCHAHAPCIPWSWILGLDSSLPASLPPDRWTYHGHGYWDLRAASLPPSLPDFPTRTPWFKSD
eukprot:11474-Heterococcus_DN1.PRE.1